MKKAYLKYIFALLLFGTNGIVASYISLSSYEIVFLRTLIGSLLLMAIFLLTKQRTTFFHYKKQFFFLILSGIAMGSSWMFLYEAYQQIGVSFSSLAYYCGPVIVILLSPILFKEKLTPHTVLGFITVLLGLFLVNGELVSAGNNLWGIFCGIMSAFMYAFMVIFNKKAEKISGLENSMLQLFVSFLTVAVFVGIKQHFVIVIPQTDFLPILFLGLVNTGIGCYLYFSSLAELPVQLISICGYLEPLSAVIFSAIVLRESMKPLQILGAVLILGGAIYTNMNKVGKPTFSSPSPHS